MCKSLAQEEHVFVQKFGEFGSIFLTWKNPAHPCEFLRFASYGIKRVCIATIKLSTGVVVQSRFPPVNSVDKNYFHRARRLVFKGFHRLSYFFAETVDNENYSVHAVFER